VAIVRPSMVCGVAGDPYPGYTGSLAGPGGVALAQAVGLYDTLDSIAMMPTNGGGGWGGGCGDDGDGLGWVGGWVEMNMLVKGKAMDDGF